MQYSGSTQLRSWLFSKESLRACREESVSTESSSRGKLARNCASGYHQRFSSETGNKMPQTPAKESPQSLNVQDQETLIRFHAHQIQSMVGPNAIQPELRRSSTVHSTAVILFRRFYLSNSVCQVSPRKMAAACAFFASKLEEERVEISLLSHATAMVQGRLRGSALCRQELPAVSISDIFAHESILMEGVNYQFICHHPHGTIGYLAKDVATFLFEQSHSTTASSCWHDYDVEELANELLYRAMQVLDRATIFSDAAFLFAPGHIAFAIVAIVVGSACEDGFLGDVMQDYLVTRNPMQTEEKILSYTRKVGQVISLLFENEHMDLKPRDGETQGLIVSKRAGELHRVLNIAHKLRNENPAKHVEQSRKRKRHLVDADFTPPRRPPYRKMVTPTY